MAVGGAAAPSIDNTATVSSLSFDVDLSNNTSTDPTVVISSDLSTSTKSVVDLNGGDADPGDTLRYTISLIESAGVAASNVSVEDDIPTFTSGFTCISTPPGSTDNSTGAGTGANGTGFVDVIDITVPASGTVSIVFDVQVAAGANPGDIISNLATITNPDGPGATPLAPDVIVSQSQIPSTGTKSLYLYDLNTGDPNGFNQGPQPYLSRTPPTAPQSNVPINRNQQVNWTMTPATQAPLTLNNGSIPITLWLSKGGGGGGPVQRTLTVSLASIGTTIGPIGTPVTQTFAAPPSRSPAQFVFNIPLAADLPLGTGSQIVLTLANSTSGGGNRRIRVFPIGTASNSRVDLECRRSSTLTASRTTMPPIPGAA